MNKFLTYCTFVAALAAYACGDDDTMGYKPTTTNNGVDSTVTTPDTSTPATDSAVTVVDAATATDSAVTVVDAATATDSAVTVVDAAAVL